MSSDKSMATSGKAGEAAGNNAVARAKPRWLAHWLERHQHPVSFRLHLVGIPLTLAALVVALVQLKLDRWDLWYRPVILLVVGYALQWLGHRLEGNDLGEMILIKRLLGRPYTAVSPRYARGDGETQPNTKPR